MDSNFDHEPYTDKYFLRSKHILKEAGINPIVRYQVFARKDLEHITGINEAINFIRSTGREIKIFAQREGDKYTAGEPIMKLEGRVQDLVDLETIYLGIKAGNITGKIDMNDVKSKANDIVKAAQGKTVLYFGARHFHYSLDEEISRICKEAGFAGASTDIGAKAFGKEGEGTIPHALIVSYAIHMYQNKIEGNPTVEAAKAFDKYIDPSVKRIVLIDTFNREITDSIETAKAIPSLYGVRIDTCGENFAQGTQRDEDSDLGFTIDDGLNNNFREYWHRKGVSIEAVWRLRRGLDEAGFGDKKIVVSSGFNAEKTGVFLEADAHYQQQYNKPLFDIIGTGSIANPVMTTSDIVAYYDENKLSWLPMHKVGRDERQSDRLHEVKQ